MPDIFGFGRSDSPPLWAGSLGSIFPSIFPKGADLTEALVFGQIAGVNAAQKK